MAVYESPYLIINYDEEIGAITEEWQLDFTTQVAGDNFREPLKKLLQEFEARKATKWLCDNTEQKTIDSKDQLWLEEHYYPKLIDLGLQTIALVNAKDIMETDYAKNSLQNLREAVITIEVFNKNQSAREWLSKQ